MRFVKKTRKRMLQFSARNLLAQFVRVEKGNKLARNENKFTKKQE
jgi:hypothetical protein